MEKFARIATRNAVANLAFLNIIRDGEREDVADAIDPEMAAEITQKYLDEHYRNCLDEPIPMLAGKTPRQCAKSKKHRELVIEWLKYLENSELRRAA